MLSTRRYRPIQYTSGNPLYHEAETHRPPKARQYRLLNWGTSPAPTCDSVCNLRAFDASDGSLLWEVLDFDAIGKAPNGSIFGYRWNNVTGSTDWVNLSGHVTRVFSGAAQFISHTFGSSSTRFQRKEVPEGLAYESQTWWADCIEVDIDGAETTLLTNACLGTSNQKCQPPTRGTFQSIFSDNVQRYRCSNAGLILGIGEQPMSHITDRDSSETNHHLIRLAPRILFAANTVNSPKWVFKTGSTTVKVDLYGTADDFETALAGLPGVDTVTVTGGPACHDYLTIDITFDDDTDQIEFLCIEYASANLPGASTTWRLNPTIWDLVTHTPKVVKALQLLASPAQLTFASSSESLIGRGNWGALQPTGARKTELSKLTWTMPGGVPNWGTIDTAVWSATPFDNMPIMAERLTVGGLGIPKTVGISALSDGQIAVTSTTCTSLAFGEDEYKSHVVIDESSGTMGDYGWSLMLNSTAMVFSPTGGFRWGRYRSRVSHEIGTPGTNTTSGLSNGFAIPTLIEVHNTDHDVEDVDMHEADGYVTNFGAGSCVVGQGWNSGELSEFGYMSPVLPSSGSTAKQLVSFGFLAHTNYDDHGAVTGVFGNRPKDTIRILSLERRFADDIEFRLWHGSFVAGSIFRNKTSPWWAPSVSRATIVAEIEGWYGTAPSTELLIQVDPFGEDSDLQDESPDLPAWQKISELWVYRDNSGGSTLVPNQFTVFGLDIRNSTPLVTRSIVGKGLTDGVVEWQRNAGYSISGSGVQVSGSPIAMVEDTVVFRTVCKPVSDPAVVGRGDP